MNPSRQRTLRLGLAGFGAVIVWGVVLFALKATMPRDRAMLRKTIQAHQGLGPCTIRLRYTVSHSDRPRTYQATVRWNNPSHYTLDCWTNADAASGTPSGAILFVDGGAMTVADRVTRRWIRLDPHDPRHAAYLEAITTVLPSHFADALGHLMTDQSASGQFALHTLKSITVDGEECIRLTVPLYNRAGDEERTGFHALLIRRSDNLIRKMAIRDRVDGRYDADYQYERYAQAFPANTFSFTPPSGYVQAATTEGFAQPQ